MTERVVDLANAALARRDPNALLGVFVAAARRCAAEEARGDLRDGLIDMPLPFAAAELLGVSVEAVVAAALEQLDEPSAACLGAYAARRDRGDVRVMGWELEASDAGWRFTGWGA